ncbi:TonB family C-terminal domain-containing protein [Mucilaginibacter gossypiicola]|uniref:TonB family C-terminal domain-containing protein n=1 Tax=Mucilaginibacter gossypiicola TaxID=551995 RepID=A0A1H8TBH2_9SPHI|nr:M56 family metallopeptidase [Mucilaginibacter gossypiicola]SEO88450.1 TonB family C-terminal domain-containing protein [Mucilaginibacter gossypiicola]
MNWWQYLLLVNIYLLLFYGFYVLLLRKETFFQLNRLYLVSAALLSFMIPVIQADWVQNLFITQQVKYTLYSSPVLVYHFKPVEESPISIGEVLFIIYFAGIVFLSGRLIWQLFKLKKVISQPDSPVSYSFFKTVKLNADGEANKAIATHEDVHAKQWHSADVLLVELVMIINWFNPIVYFYRRAIKHIHEFIADRHAVEAGTDKADYAMLLLSQTFNTPTHGLVNSFFNKSLLKERIIMLQKNKSHRTALVKYGLSAPLFILMMVLSSATINNSDTITVINTKADKVFSTPASKVTEITIDEPPKPERPVAALDTSPVYTAVARLPEFPGGLEAFGKFLSTNIKYPAAAREQRIQGRVIITFIVEKDGSLSSERIVRGITDDLNNEALRVIKLSPNWKPGMQGNRPVRTQYSVPISFTLAPSDDTTKTTAPARFSIASVQPGSDAVFTSVEQVPEFSGGLEAFSKFLMTNLRYPKAARDNNVQGRVIITFIVEKDGSLSNMKVIRGIGSGCDEEAVRVLSMSPAWKPGIQNGKPVKVQYSVPISFTLADDKSAKPGENKTGDVVNPSGEDRPIYGGLVVDTAKQHVIVSDKYSGKSAPLIIIDGVALAQGTSLNKINPNDIERISVLKDNTAVAIYGDRAVNGVVLVTTKTAAKKKAALGSQMKTVN